MPQTLCCRAHTCAVRDSISNGADAQRLEHLPQASTDFALRSPVTPRAAGGPPIRRLTGVRRIIRRSSGIFTLQAAVDRITGAQSGATSMTSLAPVSAPPPEHGAEARQPPATDRPDPAGDLNSNRQNPTSIDARLEHNQAAGRHADSVCAPVIVFLVLGVWCLASGAQRIAAPQSAARGVLAADLQDRLDPNSAPWWELTALPRIGENTARRIVDHRTDRADRAAARRDPDDSARRGQSDSDRRARSDSARRDQSDSDVARARGVGRAPRVGAASHRDARANPPADPPNTRVFRRAEDLDAVRGIGPKTVERLRPYLRFDPPEPRP